MNMMMFWIIMMLTTDDDIYDDDDDSSVFKGASRISSVQLAHHTWIMCQTSCQKFLYITLILEENIVFVLKVEHIIRYH